MRRTGTGLSRVTSLTTGSGCCCAKAAELVAAQHPPANAICSSSRRPMREPSISDGLQEPFGGNFTPQSCRFGALIDKACDRKELGPLKIAALGIRDLVARGAA